MDGKREQLFLKYKTEFSSDCCSYRRDHGETRDTMKLLEK